MTKTKSLLLTAGIVLATAFTFCGCKEEAKEKKETPSAEATTEAFTDSRDGKKYKTVKIGEQVWMAENLNYEAQGSKCYDDQPDSCARYGRLYTWDAALNACPAGWHLPCNREWDELFRFVDGISGAEEGLYGSKTAGKRLKATGGWNDYEEKSGNGTDEFGFSALPGGSGGYFNGAGNSGNWWSCNYDADNGPDNKRYYYRRMNNNSEGAYWDDYFSPTQLYSVRCVQDREGYAPDAERLANPSDRVQIVTFPEYENSPGIKFRMRVERQGDGTTAETALLDMTGAFGFTDEAGERIILNGYSKEESKAYSHFTIAIGTGGSVTKIKLSGWQKGNEKKNTGRGVSENFDNLPGNIYRVADENLLSGVHFLTDATFERSLIPFKANMPTYTNGKSHWIKDENGEDVKNPDYVETENPDYVEKVDAKTIKKVEAFKKRKITESSLLATTEKGAKVYRFVFERIDDDMLGSIVYIDGDKIVCDDHPTKGYDDFSAWRADGDGFEGFTVLFLARTAAGVALSYTWDAPEGQDTAFLVEKDGKFVGTQFGYSRYWSPF